MPFDRRTRPLSITRGKLHEWVWTEPLSSIARSLGIANAGLRQACDNYGVPRPPKGFWNMPEARRARIKVKPLPARLRPDDDLDLAPFGRTPPVPLPETEMLQLSRARSANAEARLEAETDWHACMPAVAQAANRSRLKGDAGAFAARRLLFTNDVAHVLADLGFTNVRGSCDLAAQRDELSVTVQISRCEQSADGAIRVAVRLTGKPGRPIHVANDKQRWGVENQLHKIGAKLVGVVQRSEARARAKEDASLDTSPRLLAERRRALIERTEAALAAADAFDREAARADRRRRFFDSVERQLGEGGPLPGGGDAANTLRVLRKAIDQRDPRLMDQLQLLAWVRQGTGPE